MSLLAFYFGLWHGAVWSNILAEPVILGLTALVVWPFRHHLMRRFVAFHHKHKTEHRERMSVDQGN